MTASQQSTTRTRTALASAVCLALLVTGVTLTLLADGPPLALRTPVPTLLGALLLVPIYGVVQRLTIDFELRGHTHAVTLGQLPLALGVLLVLPEAHLAACVIARLAVSAASRQQFLKALYNVGAAVFEIGLVTWAVSTLAGAPGEPDLLLWGSFFTGLLVADAVASLALSGVWVLLGVPVTRRGVLQPLLLGLAVSTCLTGVAVVAVSAGYHEPTALLLVLLLGALLLHGYRKHRRLVAQQVTTQELYSFVRDLGPVDADTDHVQVVLEQVRLLLHAERLELLTRRADRRWERLVVEEARPPRRVAAAAPLPPTGRAPASSAAGIGVVSTPLFGSGEFAGLLTARGRLGDARMFDLGDVQLLETLGSEVATALERGRLLAHLRRTATTDPLTGLPNLSETTRALDGLLRDGGPVLVAAVTVDSFREVNDTLGREVGDELLVETARRLQLTHRGALIGRIGGGRFAVAVRPDDGELSTHLLGLGIRALVEGEARVGPVGTHIRLSVGVAEGPVDGADADTLLRRAETAMSSARHAHGGPVAWAPAYEVQGQRRLAVVTALREAVATGAIGLAYQPKLDLRTGEVSGVEALARWTHPALGHVRPDEFIPLAETSGSIGPLTSAVLRQAASTCRGWQRRAAGVGVSVNVSAQTVLDPDFVGEVAAILAQTGLPPSLLTLELTEGVVVGDPVLASERLGELRALGARVAVDDFGTGYSSLTYLKGLPVDEVKIDKTFVSGLGSDPADAAVVRAVVDIAHTLGLTVVAEGVETEQQHRLLVSLEVDEVQGYLHARPMPAQSVAMWLRSRSLV